MTQSMDVTQIEIGTQTQRNRRRKIEIGYQPLIDLLLEEGHLVGRAPL